MIYEKKDILQFILEVVKFQREEKTEKEFVPKWDEFLEDAKKHRFGAMLSWAVEENLLVEPSKNYKKWIDQYAINQAIYYYNMHQLAFRIFYLFEQNKIQGVLLKGLILSCYYPKEEQRIFSDLDIYVPDSEQYEKACILLKEHDYEESYPCFHHSTYKKIDPETKKVYCLELHHDITERYEEDKMNLEINRLFGKDTIQLEQVNVMGVSFPTLEPNRLFIHLMIHLSKHIMKGLDLFMLYDLVCFLEKEKDTLNYSFIKEGLYHLKLESFTKIILSSCVLYLGLKKEIYQKLYKELEPKKKLELFMEDTLNGETEGGFTSRAVGNGYFSMLQELDAQTKMWYGRYYRVSLIRPFLWIISIFRFIKIAIFDKNVSPFKLIAMDKKRKKLYYEMNLYGVQEKKEL